MSEPCDQCLHQDLVGSCGHAVHLNGTGGYDCLVCSLAELRRQSQELERAREALRNMVAAYDLADEQGMFSDHGENHEAGMSCPGCLCDIASEECREALAALTQPAPEKP